MFGFGAVAPAWATSNIQVLGVQETVKDINGPLTGYTVTGLMPSSDPVPYPVGQGGSSTGKVYFDVVGSTPNTSGGEIGGGEGGTEGGGGNLDSGGGSGAPSGDTG